MATHSSTLAWKIPWMEEPGKLQSMGSLRVGHDFTLTFPFHFRALEKEMATHCSVLAWRIPGRGSLLGCHGVAQIRTWLKRLSSSMLYWYISFWLTSLCITGSSFIHLIRTDSNVFFLMAESHSIVYMCHSFLIHSSADGHQGCFHVLAIVNSATMSIAVYMSLWILVSSMCMPSSGIAGSHYLEWQFYFQFFKESPHCSP